MLQVTGLELRLDRRPVLRGVDLEIERGEVVALLGRSGAGKSTLLRAICGLETVESGEIRIDGKAVSSPGRNTAPAHRGTALVFQSYALWPHRTAQQHVDWVSPPSKSARVDWLERFGLGALRDRSPAELSGGEQARLALARALSSEPKLLLLDEPLRNLDPALARSLRDELSGWLREERWTVLLVTHDIEDALAFADRLCFLEDGRITAQGTAREWYQEPPSRGVAELFGPVFEVAIDRRAGALRASSCLGEVELRSPRGDLALVRPEWLERAEDGVRATVLDTRSLGAQRRVSLALGEQRFELLESSTRPEPTEGTEVRLRVRVPLPTPAPNSNRAVETCR